MKQLQVRWLVAAVAERRLEAVAGEACEDAEIHSPEHTHLRMTINYFKITESFERVAFCQFSRAIFCFLLSFLLLYRTYSSDHCGLGIILFEVETVVALVGFFCLPHYSLLAGKKH